MLVENFSHDSTGVKHFALLILLTRDGTHTGVLYRFGGVLHVVDQCWHERFRCKPADEVYDCVSPALLEEEFHNIVSVCELFVTRALRGEARRVPMAFKQPANARLSADGELIWDGGVGLTCATFVLAIFGAAYIPLIDFTAWRRRAGDDERHNSLLRLMELGDEARGISKASDDHIARVRAELPCIRVRPEEVVGAALYSDRPVGFEIAEQAGRWILDQLR
jgi:hypothetical protein